MKISKFSLIDGVPYYNDLKLKLTNNSQGYVYVYIPEFKKRYRLHRLIALKYIKNPFNLPVVNHINNIKTDNTIKNLEWSTHSKNIMQSFKDNPGRVCGGKNRKVKATHKNGNIIYFNSVRECSRYLKRDSSAVTRCCQGEWGYCNNYKLEYYDNETI